MENKNDIFAVLDIGTTKVVYIIAQKNKGKFEILKYGEQVSRGVHMGEVINIDQVTKVLSKVFNEVESDLGFEVEDVIVGIAGYNVNTKIISESVTLNPDVLIGEEDMKKLMGQVKLAANDEGNEEIIDIIPKDFTLVTIEGKEKGIENPVGSYGKRLYGNFHIITIKKTIKKHLETALSNNGKKVKKFVLEPIASFRSTLTDDEKELGVVMIDIGGGTSDFAVVKNNKLLLTNVNPIGSNKITEDLKEIFNITIQSAESLKIKHGSCEPSKVEKNSFVEVNNRKIDKEELARNIRAIVSDKILAPIFGEINNHNFTRKDLSRVVVTGGGAQLKHLKDLVAYKTTIETRIGNLKNTYEVGDSELILGKELLSPKYATVVGLLLIAFEEKLYADILVKHTTTEEIVKEKETQNKNDDKKSKVKKRKQKENKKSWWEIFWEKIENGVEDLE